MRENYFSKINGNIKKLNQMISTQLTPKQIERLPEEIKELLSNEVELKSKLEQQNSKFEQKKEGGKEAFIQLFKKGLHDEVAQLIADIEGNIFRLSYVGEGSEVKQGDQGDEEKFKNKSFILLFSQSYDFIASLSISFLNQAEDKKNSDINKIKNELKALIIKLKKPSPEKELREKILCLEKDYTELSLVRLRPLYFQTVKALNAKDIRLSSDSLSDFLSYLSKIYNEGLGKELKDTLSGLEKSLGNYLSIYPILISIFRALSSIKNRCESLTKEIKDGWIKAFVVNSIALLKENLKALKKTLFSLTAYSKKLEIEIKKIDALIQITEKIDIADFEKLNMELESSKFQIEDPYQELEKGGELAFRAEDKKEHKDILQPQLKHFFENTSKIDSAVILTIKSVLFELYKKLPINKYEKSMLFKQKFVDHLFVIAKDVEIESFALKQSKLMEKLSAFCLIEKIECHFRKQVIPLLKFSVFHTISPQKERVMLEFWVKILDAYESILGDEAIRTAQILYDDLLSLLPAQARKLHVDEGAVRESSLFKNWSSKDSRFQIAVKAVGDALKVEIDSKTLIVETLSNCDLNPPEILKDKSLPSKNSPFAFDELSESQQIGEFKEGGIQCIGMKLDALYQWGSIKKMDEIHQSQSDPKKIKDEIKKIMDFLKKNPNAEHIHTINAVVILAKFIELHFTYIVPRLIQSKNSKKQAKIIEFQNHLIAASAKLSELNYDDILSLEKALEKLINDAVDLKEQKLLQGIALLNNLEEATLTVKAEASLFRKKYLEGQFAKSCISRQVQPHELALSLKELDNIHAQLKKLDESTIQVFNEYQKKCLRDIDKDIELRDLSKDQGPKA